MATKPIKTIPAESKEAFDAALAEYYAKSAVLKSAAEQADEAHKGLMAILYPNGPQSKGIDTWAMPSGWQLKVNNKINYRLDKTAIEPAKAMIAKLEVDPETGEVPSLDGIIQWKPEFSETGYQAAPDKVKEICRKLALFEWSWGKAAFEFKEPGQSKNAPKAVAKADDLPE